MQILLPTSLRRSVVCTFVNFKGPVGVIAAMLGFTSRQVVCSTGLNNRAFSVL